jgi:two-component system LytT family response regulator
MINVIIIENCSKSLSYLSYLLEPYDDIIIVGTAASVTDGYKLLLRTTPNIVFLDIELDDGTAFQLLDKLEHKNFEIVFTTAFNDYYAKAFTHFAFNYLLKPIDAEQLQKVIKQYKTTRSSVNTNKLNGFKQFMSSDNPKILLNVGYSHILIALKDIIYCKANQNFTIFKLSSGQVEMASNPLKYYFDLFSKKEFFKANRSFLVNVHHVKKIIKRESIIMSNNDIINVSTKNKHSLKTLIENWS